MSPLQVIQDWGNCANVNQFVHLVTTQGTPPMEPLEEISSEDVAAATFHMVHKPLDERVCDAYKVMSKYLKKHKDQMDGSYTCDLEKLAESVKMVKASTGKETEKLREAREETESTIRSLQEKISEKAASATKIQAAFRGWKARQRVLPKQILLFLEKNLLPQSLDNVLVEDVALGLCREIEVIFRSEKI